MSHWPSTKASRVLSALQRLGWSIKRQSGSHKTLSRDGWPDVVFAFHDREEIGPRMLARLAKHTGLKPEDLWPLTLAYRAVNPTGAVPGLRLDDGRVLAESLAILVYLAEGTPYLPVDAYERAKVLQWLSFENDYLQNSIGSLRFWKLTGKRRPPELVEGKAQIALRCLRILDDALAGADFLVGGRYTIADMACFAYTHLAQDAGLPLRDYPNVVAWIARVREQPGFLERVYPYSVDPHSGGELP